jgi:hypothetical protein
MMLVAKLGLQLALMPFRGLAASYRPANFKHHELRVIQTQRLVVPCLTMCRTQSLRSGPCFKDGAALLHRVRSIDCAILSLGAFEKVKLYKAWHCVGMAVSRHPDLLEGECHSSDGCLI